MIIEPTSGNTGIGLAYVCAARGYKLAVTMPESMSLERRRMLKALGAELILTPAAEGMPARCARPKNWRRSTRITSCRSSSRIRPIPRSTARPRPRRSGATPTARSTFSSSGVGTGGTITGVGEVLKQRKPGVQIVAVEPANSPVITQRRAGQELKPGKHTIQGIGAGFIPDILNVDIIDDVVHVTDDDAMETARQMAKLEGLMCGISCGAAAWAAIQVAKRPENKGKLIVVILPDLGERYLSTKLFPE